MPQRPIETVMEDIPTPEFMGQLEGDDGVPRLLSFLSHGYYVGPPNGRGFDGGTSVEHLTQSAGNFLIHM